MLTPFPIVFRPGTDEESDKFYMREFNNTHDFGEATPANIMKVNPDNEIFVKS